MSIINFSFIRNFDEALKQIRDKFCFNYSYFRVAPAYYNTYSCLNGLLNAKRIFQLRSNEMVRVFPDHITSLISFGLLCDNGKMGWYRFCIKFSLSLRWCCPAEFVLLVDYYVTIFITPLKMEESSLTGDIPWPYRKPVLVIKQFFFFHRTNELIGVQHSLVLGGVIKGAAMQYWLLGPLPTTTFNNG